MTSSLTLVVCGAPLAQRAADIAAALVGRGWTVTAVGSPASRDWLDVDAVEAVTGRPVQVDHQQTTGPPPSVVVACPLTMNTASKAASGIMDTICTGVLGEALAVRRPMTLVATISTRLWGHPALAGHLGTFTRMGARFVDPTTGQIGPPVPVRSGSGAELVAGFRPTALAQVVGSPASPK